jgi:hypothetical protein
VRFTASARAENHPGRERKRIMTESGCVELWQWSEHY